MLTVCPDTKTDCPLPIKPWKTLITNVPIYDGADFPGSAENHRRVAKHFWQDGPDGVYHFGFFTSREDLVEPPFEVLEELGDPHQLQEIG